MQPLPRSFYDRDTLAVARDLLGQYLVRETGRGRLVCRITETEAYIGRMDKACHAYQYKRTARTETLFARPGTAYLYLIYGMYHCLNFVTEAEGEPCAVLIRGAVPVENGDIIAENRFGRKEKELTAAQRVRSSIKLQGSNEPSQLIFLPRRTLKMKKMTIRKMLERIVVATNKRRAKNIVLVSTDGEIVEAEFAVDLIRTLTDWNILWEVTVISEKFYEDRFVVIFDPNIKQVNGDPDKGDTWL